MRWADLLAVPVSVRVVPMGADEVSAAAAVLARAFAGDPLTSYLFPESADRGRLAGVMFAAVVRYHCMFGWAERLAGFGGVALWLGPGQVETPEGLRQAGFGQLPKRVGTVAVDRMGAVDAGVEEAHRRAVPEPHWYLRLLGVEPAQQGRGLGGDLLQHGLARADRDGVACFLETFQEQTVPFYRRHGFQVLIDDVEPSSGIRFWGLRRRPNDWSL
jgi:ribosomal protein S18 acetylase RimI-like enzyme